MTRLVVPHFWYCTWENSTFYVSNQHAWLGIRKINCKKHTFNFEGDVGGRKWGSGRQAWLAESDNCTLTSFSEVFRSDEQQTKSLISQATGPSQPQCLFFKLVIMSARFPLWNAYLRNRDIDLITSALSDAKRFYCIIRSGVIKTNKWAFPLLIFVCRASEKRLDFIFILLIARWTIEGSPGAWKEFLFMDKTN